MSDTMLHAVATLAHFFTNELTAREHAPLAHRGSHACKGRHPRMCVRACGDRTYVCFALLRFHAILVRQAMQSIKTSRIRMTGNLSSAAMMPGSAKRELHRGMAAACGPRARAACMHASVQPEGAGVWLQKTTFMQSHKREECAM